MANRGPPGGGRSTRRSPPAPPPSYVPQPRPGFAPTGPPSPRPNVSEGPRPGFAPTGPTSARTNVSRPPPPPPQWNGIQATPPIALPQPIVPNPAHTAVPPWSVLNPPPRPSSVPSPIDLSAQPSGASGYPPRPPGRQESGASISPDPMIWNPPEEVGVDDVEEMDMEPIVPTDLHTFIALPRQGPITRRTIKAEVFKTLFDKTLEEVQSKEGYLVSLIVNSASFTAAVLAVTPLLWQLRNSDDHCCQPLDQNNLNCCFGVPEIERPLCCNTTEAGMPDLLFDPASNCSVAQSAILVRRAGVSLFSALAFCIFMLTVVMAFIIPSVVTLRERARGLEFIFDPKSEECKVRMLFWTMAQGTSEKGYRIALDSMRYMVRMFITSVLCSLCVTMAQYYEKSRFCFVSTDKSLLLQEILEQIWIVIIFFLISILIVVVRLLWLMKEEEANYNFVHNFAQRWKGQAAAAATRMGRKRSRRGEERAAQHATTAR